VILKYHRFVSGKNTQILHTMPKACLGWMALVFNVFVRKFLLGLLNMQKAEELSWYRRLWKKTGSIVAEDPIDNWF